jgi:hypothetical protein
MTDDQRHEECRFHRTRFVSPAIVSKTAAFCLIEGHKLYGDALTPIGEMWVPFTVDLRTGECQDGVYEADMRRAIPIYGPQ